MKLSGDPQLDEEGANAAAEDAQTAAGAFGPSAEAPEEQEQPTGAVAQASEEGSQIVEAGPGEPAGTPEPDTPAATPDRQTDGASASAPSSGPSGPKIVVLPDTGGVSGSEGCCR